MLTAPLLASVIRDALHHFQSEDKDIVKGCCWWRGVSGQVLACLVRWAVLALCSLRSAPPCSGYALLRRAAGSAGRGGSGLPGVLWWVFWFGDSVLRAASVSPVPRCRGFLICVVFSGYNGQNKSAFFLEYAPK